MVNSYGLTEATIDSTYFGEPPASSKSATVRSRSAVRCRARGTYVLDERLEPVPVGVVGELFIGGPGVARGYAFQPASDGRAVRARPTRCAGARGCTRRVTARGGARGACSSCWAGATAR